MSEHHIGANGIHALDRLECLGLLMSPDEPFAGSEEDAHPWSSDACFWTNIRNRPLMRLIDKYTRDSPDDTTGAMMSRAPRERLDSWETRRKMLRLHADHSNRVWTPFLSYTSSPSGIEQLGARRTYKRGPQTLVAINPGKRRSLGLPLLNAKDEMNYYDVADPYGRNYEYYEDHYLCVRGVSGEEIVGIWPWNDFKGNPMWYNEIVYPQFHEFQDELQGHASAASINNGIQINQLPQTAGVFINTQRSKAHNSTYELNTAMDGSKGKCEFLTPAERTAS